MMLKASGPMATYTEWEQNSLLKKKIVCGFGSEIALLA